MNDQPSDSLTDSSVRFNVRGQLNAVLCRVSSETKRLLSLEFVTHVLPQIMTVEESVSPLINETMLLIGDHIKHTGENIEAIQKNVDQLRVFEITPVQVVIGDLEVTRFGPSFPAAVVVIAFASFLLGDEINRQPNTTPKTFRYNLIDLSDEICEQVFTAISGKSLIDKNLEVDPLRIELAKRASKAERNWQLKFSINYIDG